MDMDELSLRMDRAAAEGVEVVLRSAATHGVPERIELGYATDDHEDQSLGWPTAAHHREVLERTKARLPTDLAARVVIGPRGSTFASAAAADQYDSAR